MTGEIYYRENQRGQTYVQIAKKYGLTKGQVAGAVHRYRIGAGITAHKKKPPVKAPVVKLKAPQEVKSFADVVEKNTCRFIEGEGENSIFCGQPRANNSFYCEEHKKRCFSKTYRRVFK